MSALFDDYEDREDYYDVALICQNGHVINSSAKTSPAGNQDFCDRCGSKTVIACQQCSTDIRGFHHISGVIHSSYDRPAFCFKCGAAFPWTATGLQAARDLADVLDGLSAEDREELKMSLDDLVKDTPRTRVAETRFKKIMKRSGREAVDGMRSVLTDIVSETVRKTIFGA